MALRLRNVEINTFQDLGKLAEHVDVRVYNRDTNLIYKGHIPHVAYILVSGKIIIKTKGRDVELEKGSVVGVKELLSNTPFRYNVKIESGSEVFILDKSTLIEMMDHQDFHTLLPSDEIEMFYAKTGA
jgi:CRP-like cAMP-binding protein